MFADGERYEGQWKNNMKHGQGIFTFADGNVYEGEYKHGRREGQGRFTWADHNMYEGSFVDDMMHGAGCLNVRSLNLSTDHQAAHRVCPGHA